MKTSLLPKDKFRAVLVATDLSIWGTRAVTRALRVPLQARSKLIILHVVDSNLSEAELVERQSALTEHVEKIMHKEKISRPCQYVVAGGSPVSTIIETAKEHKVELVVLGRHSERSFRDLFIGSTAQRVARYGHASVLIVNNSSLKPYSSAIAGIDFSKVSIDAVDFARRMTGNSIKSLNLLHSHPLPCPKGAIRRAGLSEAELKELTKSMGKDLLLEMQKLVKKSKVLKQLKPKLSVICSDPRSALLTKAKKSDLIVIGAYSRTALWYNFLGSVAEFIIERSTNDICLFRPPVK